MMAFTRERSDMKAREVGEKLSYHIYRPGSFTMSNVYIKNSPWESDVIKVMKSGYWHEYEIKLTKADFKRDFQKRVCKWKKDSVKKHDLYASPDELCRKTITGRQYEKGLFPKPATFTFVCPKGMIAVEEIPDHSGLIEFEETEKYGVVFNTVKRSRRLKKPGKLTYQQLFNLCLKK